MTKRSKIAILIVAVIVITATLITTVLLVSQQQDIRREANQTYTCCSADPEGSPNCGPVTCTYPDGPCSCLPVEDCDGNTTNGTDRWCTYTAPPGPGEGFDLYKDGNNIKANNPTNDTEVVTKACFICSGPANDGCSDGSPDYLRSCGGGDVNVAPGASGQQIIGAPEVGPCENYQVDAHVKSTPPEDSDALVGQSDLQGDDCIPPTATPTQPTGTASPTPTEHKPSPTPTGVTTTPSATPTGTITSTATPTTPVGGPSATITPTPTGTNAPTSTDTPSSGSSPTPTPVTTLPDSGMSVPTILTAVLGGALLMFSLLFAL